jgi:hypothetical protein
VEAAVRSYLLDIYRSDDTTPPLMVRLAWHDAGAYVVFVCLVVGGWAHMMRSMADT